MSQVLGYQPIVAGSPKPPPSSGCTASQRSRTLSDLEYLDEVSLRIAAAVVEAVVKQGYSFASIPGLVARGVYEIADAMRIERSLRHQAIQPSTDRSHGHADGQDG
jgi:hypothetical protein